MGVFALDKAKSWIEGRIHSVLKDNKISILFFLIIISGFFFYNQLSGILPQYFIASYKLDGRDPGEKDWIAGFTEVKVPGKEKIEREKSYLIKNEIALESKEEVIEKSTETELHRIVGGAPIKEMVPSITKLDRKVAAFVVGIAKKESDWGRHAPTLAGTTCYNYWGYKGSGSRGTSMGYACFGTPEEAVDTVGKRIGTLVSKNINEPRQMLVWKCGASCASHDPAGVQKWVSDVSLYFGKVMQM
jgi:hypothetical protein